MLCPDNTPFEPGLEVWRGNYSETKQNSALESVLINSWVGFTVLVCYFWSRIGLSGIQGGRQQIFTSTFSTYCGYNLVWKLWFSWLYFFLQTPMQCVRVCHLFYCNIFKCYKIQQWIIMIPSLCRTSEQPRTITWQVFVKTYL